MENRLSTELDAVNAMLSCIGEAPINDLTTASTSDVAFAKSILASQNMEVQSEGWSFNTDYDFSLARNGDNEIVLPPRTLRVQIERRSDVDPVERGGKLYDRKNQTYVFSVNLKASRLVQLLDFKDLPQTARWYITVRSARIFQDRVKGEESLHTYTLQDELNARRLLRKDSGDRDRLNLLEAPGTIDIVTRNRRWR